MEYIVDIVIVAIVVVSVIIGYKRGLIRTLLACLTLVVAIAVSYYFGPYVGEYIKSSNAYERMSEGVVGEVSQYVGDVARSEIENAENSFGEFRQSGLAQTLSRLGFDSENAFDRYKESVISGAENLSTEYAEGIVGYVLSCLANALGVLVTFIAALILIKLLGYLIEKLFKLPVLRTVNRAGGAIAGALVGLLWAYAACMALEILLPYIPENPVVYMGMAENTILYKYFVDFNPAVLLFAGLTVKL